MCAAARLVRAGHVWMGMLELTGTLISPVRPLQLAGGYWERQSRVVVPIPPAHQIGVRMGFAQELRNHVQTIVPLAGLASSLTTRAT